MMDLFSTSIICKKNLHMVFLNFILVNIVLLECNFPTTVDASWEPDVAVFGSQDQGLQQQQMHFSTADNRDVKFGEVAAQDERKRGFVFDKVRALLGLIRSRSSHKTEPNSGSSFDLLSPLLAPAPSPSYMSGSSTEAKAPSPAPRMQPIPLHPHHHHHHHHHHHRYHPRLILPPPHQDHKLHEQNKRERIIVAVVASVGVSLVFLVLLGFIWIGRKVYKKRKRQKRTMSIHSSSGRQVGGVTGSVDHLFYLNTLSSVLEPPAAKVDSTDHVNPLVSMQNNSLWCEKEDSEIISVHEYDHGSIKYEESDGHNSSAEEIVVAAVCHSSEDDDDVSFHSVCNSLTSNNRRTSNVSLSSVGDDNTEYCISPQKFPSFSQYNTSTGTPSRTPQHHCNKVQETEDTKNFSTNQLLLNQEVSTTYPPLSSVPPPPPPPPPPPSFCTKYPSFRRAAQVRSTPSAPVSTSRIKHGSSTFRNLASTSSGADQVKRNDLPDAISPRQLNVVMTKPPYSKGSSFKGPAPPPPPAAAAVAALPLRKDGAPLPKLKPLHWDKVRAAPDRSMVWDRLGSSSFELDEEMIESLFGYNLKNAFQNEQGNSKSPSPSKHVLEPKRLQNMTILSKALNVSVEQVCEALLQGHGLSLQHLEALAKMSPTKDEEAKLSNYKGNIQELGSAERLVKAMLAVPFAFQRIEAMLYKATFEDEVSHLQNSFLVLEEACDELRSSKLFLKLLEAVLKTGNRMNMGTIRGGARAFKLDALLKLSDVKGTDGKTTLLHFVVQEIIRTEGIKMSDSIIGKINQNKNSRNKKSATTAKEKEEDYRRMGLDLVSGLSTELYNVKKTASIDLNVLATSVSNLSNGMSKLQKLLLNIQGTTDSKDGNFIQGMKSFVIRHAEQRLKELKDQEEKVLGNVKEITEYFHGEVGKKEETTNLLQIFVIVRDFLGMLDQVCKELKSLIAQPSPNPLAPFR